MKPCLTLIGKSGMLTCRMSWYLNPYLFESLGLATCAAHHDCMAAALLCCTTVYL